MRPLLLLVVGSLFVAAAAPPAREQEKAEGAPIAYGALSSLQPGDAFEYRLSVPKNEFLWGPGPEAGHPLPPPSEPEDYELKFIRLVVTKAIEREGDKGLHLRIDEAEAEGKVSKPGIYDMELLTGPGGKHARFGSPAGERDWWSIAYDTMLPFMNYPPLEKIEPNSGRKYFIFREYDTAIRGFQCFVPAEGKPVVVECRDFWTPQHGDIPHYWTPPPGYSIPEDWTYFFDPKANDLVSQPKEGRDLVPAVLKLVERQEWEPGMPFWTKMVRWTPDSHSYIRSCELIKRMKLTAEELAAESEAPGSQRAGRGPTRPSVDPALGEMLKRRGQRVLEDQKRKAGGAPPGAATPTELGR